MTETILMVDDDPLVLTGCVRALGRQFTLETAAGPELALEKIASSGPYAVIVSDMRMPGMDGLRLLHRAHELAPDSVRLILTGNGDFRTAIDAVNEGRIFRFLEKPCPNDTLARVLQAALDQYRLEGAERDLLEKTLHGSVKVLTDVLALVNPEAFSTASQVALYVKHLAARFRVKDSWRVEMAALLSNLGCVTLPTDTLEAVRLGRRLSKDQEARFAHHPAVARELLCRIPRLEGVAAMIGRQTESFRNHPHLPVEQRDNETLGAEILKVCIQFESRIRSGESHVGAIAALLRDTEEFDPVLVEELKTLPIDVLPCEPECIDVTDLTAHMVLNEDLRTHDGMLLVAKGIEVTETLRTRIQNFYYRGAVRSTIHVLIPAALHQWIGRKELSERDRGHRRD